MGRLADMRNEVDEELRCVECAVGLQKQLPNVQRFLLVRNASLDYVTYLAM
jgi:hypothetical protein